MSTIPLFILLNLANYLVSVSKRIKLIRTSSNPRCTKYKKKRIKPTLAVHQAEINDNKEILQKALFQRALKNK